MDLAGLAIGLSGALLTSVLIAYSCYEYLKRKQTTKLLCSRLGATQSDSVAKGASCTNLEYLKLEAKIELAVIALLTRFDKELAEFLEHTTLSFSIGRAVLILIATWGLGSLALAIAGLWYLCAPALAVLLFVGYTFLKKQQNRFKEELSDQLLGFSEELASSLGAGLSLSQAFRFAGQGTSYPLRQICLEIIDAEVLGARIDSAILSRAQTLPSQELKALAISLNMQYQMGGNIKQLFEEFSSQLRRRILFARNLRTQTAQGRLSVQLVGIVPIVLLFLMNLVMPGYFTVFFESQTGRLLFAIAIALDLLGFYLVSHMLRLDVGELA